MDYEEKAIKLLNGDKQVLKEIISTIKEEDFDTIKKLYFYIKNHHSKSDANKFINVIINNIDIVYDDEMNLNSNISFLKEVQPLIIKFLLINNYEFSEKQLKKMKNELLIEMPINASIEEICQRLQRKEFSPSLLNVTKLKKVINFASANNLDKVIEILVDDYDFIIQYNNSNINTSLLLKHSQKLSFREKILLSKRFNIELKSKPEEITKYLTKEEVKYLKSDIYVKNMLLSKGLRYDVLESSTITNLIDNINIFKSYPFRTINEFYESISNNKKLSDNKVLKDIYLNKIDDIYDNIRLFKSLNKKSINEIIAEYPRELIYLNLFINVSEEEKKWLLELPIIKETLYNTKKTKVYNYLNHNELYNILKTKDNIFKYKEYFNILKESEIRTLINNDKNYNNFVNSIKENKIDVDNINRFLSIFYLPYQKEFVINLNSFFPSNLYLDFFVSNIPIFLEVIKSNKNLNNIINSFDPREKKKIEFLLQNLSKTDITKIKKAKILNSELVNIIKNYTLGTDSNITDIYFNTPINKLISILKNNDNLVKQLIKENINKEEKLNIILSSNEITDIFLNKKYIKEYDRPLLLSIIKNMDRNQKEKYFGNFLIDYVYSKDIIRIYNNLKEKNNNINDTLIIDFLNDKTIKLKFSILEYLTKYKELQEDMILLLDYITVKDITTLFASLDGLDKEFILPRILKPISQSIKGRNRKKIGNFINFFKEIPVISKKDWENIISYLLYHVSLVPNSLKNTYVPVPSNYTEIKNYEIDFYHNVSDLLLKNYKLTKEEVYYLTNKYSKGFLFINNLNILYKSEKKENIKKNYKIIEVYKELFKVKEECNNKLSYELKKSITNLSKNNNKVFRENYTFYISKNKYTYLIIDNKFNSYKEYSAFMNSITTSFKTRVIKDEDFTLKNGIYFSYSNLEKNSLKDIGDDSYYLNKYTSGKKGNALTLPDNLLVVENNVDDLSLVVEAIEIYKEFKPYKEMRIILLNKEDFYNKTVENYRKNMTIQSFSKCIKMLSDNNYKYSLVPMLPTLKKHLKTEDKEMIERIIKEYNIKEKYKDEIIEILK